MANFSLPEKNVKLIIAGLVVMVAGYILMMGGGSVSLDSFNPAMFNFQRLYLSPFLVIVGIVVIIVAIMKKPSKEE